jgi:hypothetical protein
MTDHTPDPRLEYRNGELILAERKTWTLIKRGLKGDELRRELAKARVPEGVSAPILARAKV